MKDTTRNHLLDEQILWAVIDEKELAGDARQHLLGCQVCSGKVEQYRADLQEFGQKAERSVPSFSRPVKLPVPEPSRVGYKTGWLPFFAAAAMAGLVVFFYFMGMQTNRPVQITTLQEREILLEDEELMREISEMVENPLPDEIYEITGENGSSYDDFFDFIVPDTQDDFQSDLII